MAPVPKPKTHNSIHHFTHPHPLTLIPQSTRAYLCDGCKTPGAGAKYRCTHQVCDFDLHDYCATCPRTLSSFLHPTHPLTLVNRKPHATRQVDRICDVCKDPIDGIFYRCKDCEFDVHPLCTQLPEKIQHALHAPHPLEYQDSKLPGFCAVCKDLCRGWRYRCGVCNLDIHLDCVLEPVVKCKKPPPGNGSRGTPNPGFEQGIPFPGPGYYGYPYQGPVNGFGPPPAYYYPGQEGAVSASGNGGKRKAMIAVVGKLGLAMVSNMIFGMDLSSFF